MAKRRDNAKHGPAAFDRFYESLYGDRWPQLKAALLASAPRVALTSGLTAPYYLDPASALAALALEVEPGDRVLDLCAAPGGKTLVLARARPAVLVANERSSARRSRLHRVLDDHLPAELRAVVSVTGHDAARWGLHEPGAYHRVLADVPCSSERHVIAAPAELARWSASRTARLAAGAYAILCAAVDSLAPGGRVVYSTCALSPAENDGVVAKVLSGKRPVASVDALEVINRVVAGPAAAEISAFASSEPPGRPTEHGLLITPDADGGIGPIYIAILTRSVE